MRKPLKLKTIGATHGEPTLDCDRIAADLQKLNVGQIRFDRHNRGLYSTDASLYQVEPIGVVIPSGADVVPRVLRYCSDHAIALMPRGGGTSLAGQCANRAIVLDLSASCRRVVSIDRERRECVVEPGISIDELNRTLVGRGTGLFFAADPATIAQASIGGCIGNNAAGARSIRYGRTSENLSGVEVALAGGERTWLEAGAGKRDPIARRLAVEVGDIARRHADLIRQRFPRLVRRNAGYGLDLVLAQLDRGIVADDLDLSGLICGSEGGLAVVVGAKLKLHPLPRARALGIASFLTLEDAIDAVARIVKTGASAVELLDEVVLEAARGNTECRRYVELLPLVNGKSPRAALYVEYQAEQSIDELEPAFDALREVLAGAPLAIYRDGPSMQQAWMLRKAGEALLHALAGKRKPVTFVEDNSVPVEQLSRFVAGFRRIVAAHGTDAAYYAHASVGVLHVRPMLDLHEERDLQHLRDMAVEVADLARECGGVMSGEHGDGRIRGPLLERFFGPELIEAFRQTKHVFDPRGILNPGMVVGAGSIATMTDNLRIDAEGKGPPPASIVTYFDYSDQEGFRSAVEMCNGAGFCRKTEGGTMCPSYRATLDERHSTRGRGNALRLAITGQYGQDSALPAWDDPGTIQTLDLCLSCKACKTECPSNVDVARLKAEYTAQRYQAKGGAPIAARVFGNIRRLNQLGSAAPRLANWVNALPPVRAMLNKLLGLAPQRGIPSFAPSLHGWFKRRRVIAEVLRGKPRVALFADCFTTYNEPEVGQAAITVLEALGYEVELPMVGCCGRAQISTGLLPQAIASADRALADLRPLIEDEKVLAILVCEPSCLSAIKDDWLSLKLATPVDLRRKLAAKAMLPEDFVERHWEQHPRKPVAWLDAAPQSGPPILLHGHCHQKALWGEKTSSAALHRLVGDRITTIPSGCCGMAGSFGYTADHYDLSMKIGELSLFLPVRAASNEAIILAPGTSCRHQIKEGANRSAIHPIQLLARLMG